MRYLTSQLVAFSLCVLLLVSACSPVLPNVQPKDSTIINDEPVETTTEQKRFPSDVSLQAQQEIAALEEMLDANQPVGIGAAATNQPISTAIVSALLDAVDSPSVDVKAHALTLLAEVVKQFDVPRAMINEQVKPVTNSIIAKQATSTDPSEAALVELVNHVNWQLQLREITDVHEKLAFLQENLENVTDGTFYYSFEAMDHLVRIGSDQAKQILEEKIAESSVRSIPKDITERLQVSVEKINVQQQLQLLEEPKRAQYLGNLIANYMHETALVQREFVKWLIGQLETIGDAEAVRILKSIWQDQTYPDEYRYEGQESLYRLGAIEAQERTIYFD